MDLTSLDRYATLTVRYAQRHGDIVVVMSDRGVLFCRRESWQPWCAGVSVAVGRDDSFGAVRARLLVAHTQLVERTGKDGRRAQQRRQR